MAHALDGARLKVVRAQEHLKSFNEDGWRYMSTEPYQTVLKREGNVVTVECVITAEPPPRLACIVGDCVTNLRAALDYIAWELFLKFGPSTLSESQKRKIVFPICDSHASFTKPNGSAQSLGSVYGLGGAAAFREIENVQPYHAWYESLDTLNLLVNRDKHRMLLLCCSVVFQQGELSFFQGDKPCWRTTGGIGMKFDLDAWGPKFAAGSPPLSVKVETKPTVLVALKDFPVPPTTTYVGILDNVLKCVANVIPRFDSFF
jgi:hypothetical protein